MAEFFPDHEWRIYESRDNEPNCLWKFNPDSRSLRCLFTYRNPYQSMLKEWGYEYDSDAAPFTSSTAFTLDGRPAASGQKGFVIEGGNKVVRQ